MIKHICYTSIGRFDQKTFLELISDANNRNESRAIGGIVSYKDNIICQIIEGPDQILEDLFTSIKNDQRHFGITLISRTIVKERYYKGFGMSINSPMDVATDSLEIIRKYGVGTVGYGGSSRMRAGIERYADLRAVPSVLTDAKRA